MSEKKEPSVFKKRLIPSADAQRAAGMTRRAIQRIFTPVHSEREESFAEAAERLEWSEDDIAGFLSYRKKEVAIYAVLTGVAFLFACASPYSDSPISHLITSLAVMLMIGTRLLVAHFRLTQVRRRALYSFAEYLGILFPVLASSVTEIEAGMSEEVHNNKGSKSDESGKVVDLTRPHE